MHSCPAYLFGPPVTRCNQNIHMQLKRTKTENHRSFIHILKVQKFIHIFLSVIFTLLKNKIKKYKIYSK
ncbi:hypothetical protein Hanom_Chr05g00470881 [Helianthus anomalus]